jgi:ABC-type phosphate transport system substrate-binding protein
LLKKYVFPNFINWPDNGSIATTGPDDLAAIVRKTPYSIGYVDFSYAIQTKMTFAAIANMHSGRYITPSMDSIDQAVNTALKIQNESSNANQTTTTILPVINSSNLGNSSYPIVGLYYATVISDKSSSADERNGTLDFVKWIVDTGGGQQALPEVQYPPIYNNGTLMAYTQAIR